MDGRGACLRRDSRMYQGRCFPQVCGVIFCGFILPVDSLPVFLSLLYAHVLILSVSETV